MSTQLSASPSRLALVTAFAIVYVDLGLDLPRDPVRDRDAAAVSDGRRALHCRRLVALRLVAPREGRRGADARALARDRRRRRAAPARWQRLARVVRAAHPVRRGGAARRHGALLHGVGRLAAAGGLAADRPRGRGLVARLAGPRVARRAGYADGWRPRRFRRRDGRRSRVVLMGAGLDLLAPRGDPGFAVLVDGDADARGRCGAAGTQRTARRAVGIRRQRRVVALRARVFSISSCSARSSLSARTSGYCESARRHA